MTLQNKHRVEGEVLEQFPSPEFTFKDCSSENRKKETPPIYGIEGEALPANEQMVFLLGLEAEKLHSEIEKLTEKAAKVLSILEIIKKL